VTHNSGAQTLTTEVRPADIPAFAAAAASSDACSDSGRFVMYSDAQKALWVVDAAGATPVQLSRGESDLITIVPMTEVKGLCIAPIGGLTLLPPTPFPRFLLMCFSLAARWHFLVCMTLHHVGGVGQQGTSVDE
jgi:hypothetical protein